MNTEERNENLINQLANGLSLTAMAAAGAAVLGGALYYYLNNPRSMKTCSVIDYQNQTREVEVIY